MLAYSRMNFGHICEAFRRTVRENAGKMDAKSAAQATLAEFRRYYTAGQVDIIRATVVKSHFTK